MTDALQELLDRASILECLRRYTRGADRVDAELVRSAYHDDARDFRGPEGGQTVDQMVATWYEAQPLRLRTQHYATNTTVDLDGDVAHAETYWLAVAQHIGNTNGWLIGGRYLDRLERRNGEWRIAKRILTREWMADAGPTDLIGPEWSRRDRTDLSYTRPLADPVVQERIR
jgi:hypothetical protein